jgi:homeobox protein ESX1
MSKPPAPDAAAESAAGTPAPTAAGDAPPAAKRPAQKDEKGGPVWPEPTRYGDWERKGRVSDF